MQVSSIGTKEQIETGSNSLKNVSVQLTGDFLAFMKNVDIMAKPENNGYTPADKPVDTKTNDKKDTAPEKKEEETSSSQTDTSKSEQTKDTPKVEAEKSDTDKTSAANDTDTNKEDTNEVPDEMAAQTTNRQPQEQAKTNTNGTEKQLTTQTQSTNPEASAPVETTKTENVPQIDVPKSQQGEKIAGQNPKSDSVLPQKELATKGPQLSTDGEAIPESFKSVISGETKVLAEANSNNQPIKNTQTSQTETQQIKLPENVSEEVLQQAETLADKIGKDIKNPIKVNVDITKPETTQTTMSQETLSVLNKDMEIKTQTNPNSFKNMAQTSQDTSTLAETTATPQKTFTSTLSTVAKMAREQILGKETAVSQAKDTKLPTNEIGIGLASTDTSKTSATTSSNMDSDILLMSKTYASGKATGSSTNNTVTNTKQQLATPKQVIDQIKVQIKQTNAADKITVKLNPKELGQVELKVEVSKSGSMNVEITANKKETLELLKQDIKYLEKALQETVAKSESTPNFTFNLKGETNQGQAQNGHGQSGKEANQGNNQQQASNDNATEETANPREYQRSGISIKV